MYIYSINEPVAVCDAPVVIVNNHRTRYPDNTQKSSRAKGVSDDEEYSENEGVEPNGTQTLSLTQAQRDLALGDDEAFEAKYRDQVRREIEEKGAKRMQKIGVSDLSV